MRPVRSSTRSRPSRASAPRSIRRMRRTAPSCMRSSRRTASMPSCISRASRRSARAAISRWPYYRNNLDSTLALLEEMAQAGCTRFVFSSSATVYGPDNAIPYVETMPTYVATNPYGWTKVMIEQILRDLLARQRRAYGRAAALLNPIRRPSLGPARRRSERHPEQSHALYRPRGGRSAGQADDLRRRPIPRRTAPAAATICMSSIWPRAISRPSTMPWSTRARRPSIWAPATP